MKLKLKHSIPYEQADKLIEKFYEGLTTLDEEKLLQAFLSHANLPSKYKTEQAIFGYFSTKKQKKRFQIRPFLQWTGAAAAMLILALGIETYAWKNQESYAYIDGVKITNKNEIKTQALASLSIVSADNYEVEQSLENLNDSELMQNQLDVFSGLSE